jgi:membrane associated rhomboid family serine protease
MIETTCQCGAGIVQPETSVGEELTCERCGTSIHLIAGEALPEGAGAGDFDARLLVVAGPSRLGEQFLLGGVPELTAGKLAERSVPLAGGKMVSRHHCTFRRLDFGPSRWEIIDNNSSNGTWVDGQKISSIELRDGAMITLGEYQLKYLSTFDSDLAAAKAKADKAAIAAGAAVCPSCGKVLARGAKICVSCGVDVRTGRSLVVSKGLDEEALEQRADTWIRTASWFIPLGIFPIASEAFGTKKPLATWIIFAITTIVSIWFMITLQTQEDPSLAVMNLMQWNGGNSQSILMDQFAKLEDQLPASKKLTEEQKRQIVEEVMSESPLAGGSFHWYQPLTSALLHDPDLIMPFISHLGGNMLFLLVFGLRVNELIGTWRTACAYVLLAYASGLTHHFMTANQMMHPSLGASGAVMGLAGMYFVFFPIQRVHMAIWFRGGWLTRFRCFYKTFTARGFWLLVLWIGLQDILLPALLGSEDGVAHSAHIGGFGAGMLLATGLLVSRQATAMGGDLISVCLGKKAWALVGKPGTHQSMAPAM